MAIRPITCPRCSQAAGWYEDTTGCLRNNQIPEGMKVFGAYLTCPGCSRGVKFDGNRIRNKRKAKLLQQQQQRSSGDTPTTIPSALGSLSLVVAA